MEVLSTDTEAMAGLDELHQLLSELPVVDGANTRLLDVFNQIHSHIQSIEHRSIQDNREINSISYSDGHIDGSIMSGNHTEEACSDSNGCCRITGK
jgi:hypothetical protein